PHTSIVRNVAPPCCEWNLFLPGTRPNSYTRGFNLILPNWSSILLPLTESSTPVAYVSLSTIPAVEQPLTSTYNPLPDTLGSWPKLKLSSLTNLPLHSPRPRIVQSPKQNPYPPRVRHKRERLPPNRPIANASARHTPALTRLHGADAFAIGH